MSQAKPKKIEDANFSPDKDFITNFVNWILLQMEQVAADMAFYQQNAALKKMYNVVTAIYIPKEETQMLQDREELVQNYKFNTISSAGATDYHYRLSQYLARTYYQMQHGFKFQNPTPQHIGERPNATR